MTQANAFKFKLIFTTLSLLTISIYASPIVINLVTLFLKNYSFIIFTLIAILSACLLIIISISIQIFILFEDSKKKIPLNRAIRIRPTIKYSGIFLSALYTLLLPFIYILAEKDDAPGLIIIYLVLLILSLYLVKVFSKYTKNINNN